VTHHDTTAQVKLLFARSCIQELKREKKAADGTARSRRQKPNMFHGDNQVCHGHSLKGHRAQRTLAENLPTKATRHWMRRRIVEVGGVRTQEAWGWHWRGDFRHDLLQHCCQGVCLRRGRRVRDRSGRLCLCRGCGELRLGVACGEAAALRPM
jgi:hypothetical protein